MASTSKEIILTSSPSMPIAAYDPLSGTTLGQFNGSRSPRKGLTVAGNSMIAASHVSATATSGFIRLYHWWSSTALNSIPVPEPIAPIVATSDGYYLFSGGLSGHIHIHSLPSGNYHRSFRAHSQPVSCLLINEDGSLLISGGDDGTIAIFPILRLLDASSDKDDSSLLALYQFTAHCLSVTSIASGLGACNSTIISSSLDSTCKFWSVADGIHLRTVQFPCAIWCIVVDPTNSEAYAGGSDGRVHVIPLKVRGRRRQGFGEAEVMAWKPEQSGAVMAVAMANGNRNLVSASEDGIIRIWEVQSGSIVKAFGHDRGSISDLVVAKGVVGTGNGRNGGEKTGSNGRNSRFCEREIKRHVREVGEMEAWLQVAMKDRTRGIDLLEVAIGTYEKLLRLLLKEATGSDGEEKEDKDSDPAQY